MPFIDKNPLEYPANGFEPIRRFKDTRAPTVADYKQFKIGDMWLDTSSDDWYICCYKDSTQAIWRFVAGTAGAVEDFTPDTGGQVGADALNNVNLLGNSGAYLNGSLFIGDPANNTLSVRNLRNNTKYVVDATADETEYATIQSALDAANTAAVNATIYIRPGTYTEDLTLYDGIQIVGATGFSDADTGVEIIGMHTPPLTGGFCFRNIKLTSATNVINSAAAGTAHLIIADCAVEITNGYLFNVLNWTGILEMWDINSGFGTNDGCVNNTGGATVLCYSGSFGVGTGNTMIVSGNFFSDSAEFFAPISLAGTADAQLPNSTFAATITTSDTASSAITNSLISTGASQAITHNSTSDLILSECTIDSSNNPAIGGTGTIVVGNVVYLDDANIAAGVTLESATLNLNGPIEIIPIDATVAANDAYIHYAIPGVSDFASGIDNSDSDKLKITNSTTPSLGTTLLIANPTNYVVTAPTAFTVGDEAPSANVQMQNQFDSAGNVIVTRVANTDNTNAASLAAFVAASGGESGGDCLMAWYIGGGGVGQQIIMGLDNDDANNLVIETGNLIGVGSRVWQMTHAGERRMPLQPCFNAYSSAQQNNVTGNGNLYTVQFQTERFDQNSDYAIGTGIFTAPVTGQYIFHANVTLLAVGASTTGNIRINTSNAVYLTNIEDFSTIGDSSADAVSIQIDVIADMDAADTAQVDVVLTGIGADTADVSGTGGGGELQTYFHGGLFV